MNICLQLDRLKKREKGSVSYLSVCVLTLKGSRKHPLPTRQVCSLFCNALGDGLGEPGISALLFAMTMLFLLSFFLLNGMVWGPGL